MKIQKKIFLRGGGGGLGRGWGGVEGGGPIRNWGGGGGGSKLWGRWVMWGMGDVNKEPEDQWSCKRSPDILAKKSTKHTKPGKYMVKK